MAQPVDHFKLQSFNFHADANKTVRIKIYRHAERINETLKYEKIQLKNCGTQIIQDTKRINNRIVWTSKEVFYPERE